MDAVVISTPGPPSVLTQTTIPTPTPAPETVLIKVAAAGVNRPDCLQRQGKYAPPPGAPNEPGLEVAGTIVAHGPNCPAGTPPMGARVCALLAGGGYAQYAVAPVGQILPLPETLSDIQGAAMPETLFTVYQNLVIRGQMKAGETVLIHGGTSGIGTMAIRFARAWAKIHDAPAPTIIVTCGSDEKCAAAMAWGATHAINYHTTDFVATTLQITHNCGVDLVLDMVGGDYVPRNLACLAPHGRHLSIATQAGATTTLDLRRVMSHSLVITGGTLRPQSIATKTNLRDGLVQTVWPLAEADLCPLIDRTLPLSQASTAHTLMESGQVIGKIILIP